jgi:TetR/AcrR family transcriptional regulator, tetracycline repressor protein
MPLQRETVVRAALHVLDEVGLDGLTMRRIAAYLDIQNPSLYWHFTNKQELLNCMAEVIIADAFAELQPRGPDQDWAEWLADFARLLRRMTLAHRDGARTLGEADLSLSKFFVGTEMALDVLQNAGFEGRKAAAGVIAVLHYVLGNTFEAQADPSSLQIVERDNSPSARWPSVDGERFPRLAALHIADALPPASPDAWFEEGLSLILDGLRANLAKERPDSTSR